ncbi:MAG TPA: hypothetical protein VLH85_09590 [Levilinea sp.]|nr:hypothetical protein [Levilinea sp.]
MGNQVNATAESIGQMVCVNHPNRQTYLSCSRCSDPICTSCAVHTETGYRCRKCLRTQQKIFITAKAIDYPLAFVVAVVIALIGSYIASFIGFFVILIGPVSGVAAAEGVRLVTGRRRGNRLFQVATAGVVVGSLPLLLGEVMVALLLLGTGNVSLFALLRLVWPAVFTFLAASTAYYRLSGIRMRR